MTELLKPQPRDLLKFGAAFVLVVALIWGSWSVAGLKVQRDQLQAQVGALRNRPPATSPPTSAPTAPPSSAPSPESPEVRQPGGTAVVAAERPVDRSSRSSDRQGGGRSDDGSPSQPAPPSTPADPPGGSGSRCLLELPETTVCASLQIGGRR